MTVQACPECDSTCLRQRTRVQNIQGAPRRGNPDHQFTCDDCKATFDEPLVRKPVNKGGTARRGLAHTLDKMAPDGLGGDET